MTGDLYAEIAAQYHYLHREDPRPEGDAERQADFAHSALRGRVIELVSDGVPPEIVETALFRYWLRVAAWNHDVDDGPAETSSDLAGNLAEELFDLLEETAAAIVDDGPTERMRDLGLLLDEARGACSAIARPRPLRRREAERQKKESLDSFARFLDECVVRLVHPGFIESAFLYCWLRTHTTTIGAVEEFFQRLERNWPEVLTRVDDFIRLRADGRSTAACTLADGTD